ncbi:MerR family transcriptional regulator [Methylorubrum zatmanii]|uniref:MerR family transcriptional regulator n=1 Tax=Methylorubrum zatmanii TaxID=29429 RepID=A0ABW1WYE5_9HYPH|nr:MerR family transcriptional regulator [Methylorubrum zatmanii]MBD8905158.1 MerR family transcriptional regulator [Methylorubrum zatmanii]
MGLPLESPALEAAADEERGEKHPGAFRTITEVSEDLGVPQHVLRFWESRFSQIKPLKRAGGRRYYRPDDVDLLRGVRRLLHGQGYTIRGAQRILKENGVRFVQAVGRGEEEAGAPTGAERDLDTLEAAASDRRALEEALADLRACRALLAGLDAADPEAASAA